MKKSIALLLSVLVCLTFFPACLRENIPPVAATASPATSSGGLIKLWVPPTLTVMPNLTATVLPTLTIPELLSPVVIPDAALNKALHDTCGKPLSEDLLEADLASLSGTLDLSGLGIADAAGVEYCTNISILILTDNQLSKMPENLSSMVSLTSLILRENEFVTLPNSVTEIPGLTALNMSYNMMESLPDSLCGMQNLLNLNVANNRLYSLPSDMGLSKIEYLVASANRIGSIPTSIGKSTSLDYFDMRANRLTTLPSNLSKRTFEEILLDFNFMDVSAGSVARKEIDEIIATVQKRFERQLLPLQGLTVEPGTDQITLKWEAAEGFGDSDYTIEVVGCYLYQMDGTVMNYIDTLVADVTAYTCTGLSPASEYTYRVGVEYKVAEPYFTANTRYYTDITAATVVQSASPTVSASSNMPSATMSITPDVTAAAGTADIAVQNEASLPGWALAVMIVGGVLICGACVAIILLLRKKSVSSRHIPPQQ
jgi:hypothetical protein